MTILSLIPEGLKTFLREIEEAGARLCLVGGASRDFFMSGILSNDLDFEVRGVQVSEIRELFKKKGLSYTELPYEIVRVNVLGFDLEFSSPRLEIPLAGNKSHHHFEAILDPKLSYERSFARRDFTLNAIGIELDLKNDKANAIDPFSGREDLAQKTLREINDSFFLDSVRFLRLVRFHVKYDFLIGESLKNQMGLFDLSELSLHHFKEEMRKSGKSGPFINEFSRLVKEYALPIADQFKFWGEFHFSSEVKTTDDLLVRVFLKEPLSAKKVMAFFSLPEKKLKDLASFFESYQHILKLTKEDIVKLAQGRLEEDSVLLVLRDLKNLEEKKEWREYFPHHLIVSWDDWQEVSVDSDTVQKTPQALRSYLRYYETLKKVAL